MEEDRVTLLKLDINDLPNLEKKDIEVDIIPGEWGMAGVVVKRCAVKITHIPTGLFCRCDKHRAQKLNFSQAAIELNKLVGERLSK
ncbi:hypothetical protein H0A36_11920 [Endozoicomonas sp. SM1973]|uniref:Peptide chain release factor 2 n=1 Tax=Spartinivicinus marinus TaxID=2994442 RepID=A0A853I7U1_9GAMM|nr:hypothetical protein [Spartinivicinus marinus]MCX4026938.1 hypothetical protein [Spartinivicinus marinus]NYZ66718.1 hypothetical protein [Spartinivicinus marinus]